MKYFHVENKVELAVLTAVAITAVAALTPSFEHIFTNVSAQSGMTNNSTLFVTGSATNQVKPDKVTLSLGVETTNSTAQAASQRILI